MARHALRPPHHVRAARAALPATVATVLAAGALAFVAANPAPTATTSGSTDPNDTSQTDRDTTRRAPKTLHANRLDESFAADNAPSDRWFVTSDLDKSGDVTYTGNNPTTTGDTDAVRFVDIVRIATRPGNGHVRFVFEADGKPRSASTDFSFTHTVIVNAALGHPGPNADPKRVLTRFEASTTDGRPGVDVARKVGDAWKSAPCQVRYYSDDRITSFVVDLDCLTDGVGIDPDPRSFRSRWIVTGSTDDARGPVRDTRYRDSTALGDVRL